MYENTFLQQIEHAPALATPLVWSDDWLGQTPPIQHTKQPPAYIWLRVVVGCI